MTPLELTVIIISFGTLMIMFILFLMRTIKRGDMKLYRDMTSGNKKTVLKKPASSTAQKTKAPSAAEEVKRKPPCILCGTQLKKGENMKSKKFEGTESTIVHIHGCPFCYGENAAKKRTCPICKKELRTQDYMMGKMWKTKKGKLHLHVSGCTQCQMSK